MVERSQGNFSFIEDRKIIADLDDLAEARGTDRSSLIRLAIRQFLERETKH